MKKNKKGMKFSNRGREAKEKYEKRKKKIKWKERERVRDRMQRVALKTFPVG